MIKFLLNLLLLFYPAAEKIQRIPTSFIEIKRHLNEGADFTLIYLFKPWCKPCIDNLPMLQELKGNRKFKVVLLTTANEKVSILNRFGFDTCFHLNPLIYKTHTLELDEYDQFTNEVFADAKIIEPSNRIRFPAVFVYSREGKLVYFNEDENSSELELKMILSLK